MMDENGLLEMDTDEKVENVYLGDVQKSVSVVEEVGEISVVEHVTAI